LNSSDSDAGSNGERGVEHVVVDTLVLTYDRATDHLEIGGGHARARAAVARRAGAGHAESARCSSGDG